MIFKPAHRGWSKQLFEQGENHVRKPPQLGVLVASPTDHDHSNALFLSVEHVQVPLLVAGACGLHPGPRPQHVQQATESKCRAQAQSSLFAMDLPSPRTVDQGTLETVFSSPKVFTRAAVLPIGVNQGLSSPWPHCWLSTTHHATLTSGSFQLAVLSFGLPGQHHWLLATHHATPRVGAYSQQYRPGRQCYLQEEEMRQQ